MSEEIRNEGKVCKCEDAFKKFAILTTAAFTGCFLALCVFSALTRPQMPPMPMPEQRHYNAPIPQEFHRPDRPERFEQKRDFQGKRERREFRAEDREHQAPEEFNRPPRK